MQSNKQYISYLALLTARQGWKKSWLFFKNKKIRFFFYLNWIFLFKWDFFLNCHESSISNSLQITFFLDNTAYNDTAYCIMITDYCLLIFCYCIIIISSPSQFYSQFLSHSIHHLILNCLNTETLTLAQFVDHLYICLLWPFYCLKYTSLLSFLRWSSYHILLCISLCIIVMHNTAQIGSDNLPS